MKDRRILIVDDESAARELISDALREKGYACIPAQDGSRALKEIKAGDFDLVLLDLKLPDVSGLQVLQGIRSNSSSLPVVLFSAYGTVDSVVKAMKLGAYDFIEKPIDIDHLLVVIRNALSHSRLEREVSRLREELGRHYQLVGSSPLMQVLREQIENASSIDAHVLITGETGAGKDLVARAIHAGSGRVERPLVKVNCAAIPDGLVESELFGYTRGAFTGALRDKPGKVEAVDGGTIFFDEIGDMNLAAQAKLLQFLESSHISRLGETKTRRVDVRIIAATNHDLNKAVDEGGFRKDLYYRLNVIDIHVPSLRSHPEDIPELTDYFLKIECARLGLPRKFMDKEALHRLTAYSWPGNVRELRNVIKKAVHVTQADRIKAENLPRLSLKEEGEVAGTDVAFHQARRRFERKFIQRVLEEEGYRMAKAARRLGFNRSYLYRKMKELGIKKGGG